MLAHAKMETDLLSASPPEVRRIGAVNWLGFWTLYAREGRRFLKVSTQTVMGAVFALAMGGAGRSAGGVPYAEFLAPGLVIMAMMQNSFGNTSSSMIISKV